MKDFGAVMTHLAVFCRQLGQERILSRKIVEQA